MPVANLIPKHLIEHVAEQNYSLYTAIDHASWRYIMRVSQHFFKDHAHAKYISGLSQTGITTDCIPKITEMDEKLKKLGWRAVTVTGFIPPSVFLEFHSLGILPIACDMRRLEHLEYTPSPDIVHEAAGHAPIIADPAYRNFLRQFGEVSRKAIFAKEDLEVYHAIKYLSDIKEDPKTTAAEIHDAYTRLSEAQKRVSYVSEAAKLSRFGWWSIEYGLFKTDDQYKIFGAGLLSSVSESYNAIMNDVKKIPLDIHCVQFDFDITKPQPQLFYVEDFSHLEKVLNELASTMAFRKGGAEGLAVAKKAQTVCTVLYDTKIQISGILNDFLTDKNGEPIYLQFKGPTQLACNDIELEGHSASYHREGFGAPVGKIKSTNIPFDQLKAGDKITIEYNSGVKVSGEYQTQIKNGNHFIVLSLTNCTVQLNDKILFDPSWGVYDLALGTKVISVFGGAADRSAYAMATQSEKPSLKVQTSNMTKENEGLVGLYENVRLIRERGVVLDDLKKLKDIHRELSHSFQSDWLLRLEMRELLFHLKNQFEKSAVKKSNTDFAKDPDFKEVCLLDANLETELSMLANSSPVLASLIRRGGECFYANIDR